MKKIGNLFFYFLFFSSIFFIRNAFAEINLNIEINPEAAGVGDQVQISLIVQANEELDIQEPQFPPVEGLTLLQSQNAGQSSSSRMNIINGKTEFSKMVSQQYDYIFQANKQGIITIPSFKVSVNEQSVSTPSKKISISKVSQNQNNTKNRRQKNIIQNQFPSGIAGEEQDDDLFSQMMNQRQKMIEEMQKQMGMAPQGRHGFGGSSGSNPAEVESKKLDVNEKESFFIYLDIDKKEVYEGEQITANWYIYTRGNLEVIDRAKFPDLKGFWKEIIEEVPNLQFTEEIVNGVRFKKGLLASHALFPIKAGVAVVDEFKIKGKVRLPTQFGWGQLQEYTRASRRAPIKVLSLPTEGKPHSFSGAVGQFQIQTHIEGLQFPANQPFTLKVKFEGSGNAKLIELPPIEWPAGLEVYDTKSESKFFKNGQSYKEFEILLVPKNKGDLQIPQITFSYFDPTEKKYITKNTEALNLKILEGLQASQNLKKNGSSDERTSAENLNIEMKPSLELPENFSWLGVRYSILIGGLGLIFSLMTGLFLKKYFQISQRPQFKKTIDQKIIAIQKFIDQKEDRKAGAESVQLIYILLAQLAQEKTASTEWHQMISKVPQNYRNKFEVELAEKFEYFQIIGFAPDEVKLQLVAKKVITASFADLKKLAFQIISDLPKE